MSTRPILTAACVAALSLSAAAQEDERPAYGRWTSSALGGGGFVMGVRYSEADPDRLWAHTDVGGVYRSDDGGESWRHASHSLPYGVDEPGAAGVGDRGLMYVRDMVGDPDQPDRAIALFGYEWSPDFGLYATDDAGETWRNVQEMWAVGDTKHREYGRALVRSVSSPTTLYAAGRGQGVFKSTDDGETWQNVGGPSVKATDLDVHPDDPNRVWLSAVAFEDTTRDYGQMPGGLWHSTDGGENWEQLNDRDTFEVTTDPGDPDVLWGIFDDGYHVERSGDGGRTWTRAMAGLQLAPEGATSTNPEHFRYQGLTTGPGFLLATSAKGDVYRLEGKTWRRIGPESVTEPADWHGYTKAEAEDWAPWVSTMNSATGVYPHPADPRNVWWMTDWYSVYQTTDGGRTWTNQTNGIEETYVHTIVGDAADPTRVHLGVADIGYFTSGDAGGRFVKPKREPITNNVAGVTTTPAQPGRVYAVGPRPPVGGWYAGHVFVSDDGGKTWTPSDMTGLPEISEEKRHANDVAADPSKINVVYLGVDGDLSEEGGLYVSRDGGRSWERDVDGFPASGEFFPRTIWDSGPTIALASDGTQMVGAPQRRMLLVRESDSEKWRAIDYPFGGDLAHLAADPHTPGRFYAAAKYDGVYRTDDRGRSWTKLDIPASTPGATHLMIDPHAPDRLAAGTPRGVILSNDAGETWEVLDRTLPGRVDWNSGAFVRTEKGRTRLVVGSGGTGVFWTAID